MTLQVPFEDFGSTAKRFGIEEAYLRVESGTTSVTGHSHQAGVTVFSQTASDLSQAKIGLESAGLKTYRGIWTEDPLPLDVVELGDGPMFVAAVSYQSGEHIPGVWMDAFSERPNHVQVLHALYEEFVQTGEMPNITIEQFIRGANPNVVVVSDVELRGYRDAKRATP